jgi:hypothetical protein
MDYMAPIVLTTITTPLTRDVVKIVRAIDVEISTLWDDLIPGFCFSSLDYNRKLDHGSYFYPGAFGLQGWSKVGPGGKGLLRVLIELIQFNNSKVLLNASSYFISEFGRCIKGLSYVSRVGVTPIFLIHKFIGLDWLKELTKVLPHSCIKKLELGPRVLAMFPDGCMKNRYIALADWLTQMTLAPLHHALTSLLRFHTGGTDYTHDQGSSIDSIVSAHAKGLKSWCFDLSAATDRLPLSLEAAVLRCCGLSRGGVDSWRDLMVHLPFHCPGHSVYYAAGQGIGLYSSWVSMASLHHYLVRLSAFKALGIKDFRLYMILGDDVVIFDEKVAMVYVDIITSLGVRISAAKTVRPTDPLICGTEFASKLIVNGIDISPLPLGLLIQKDSDRLLNLFVYVFEMSMKLGGSQLVEKVLRCTPSWLVRVSRLVDSDFKVPSVREDWLACLGFYIGYLSYLKVTKATGVVEKTNLEEEHSLYVSSLFPGTSLRLFLEGIPFSFWEKVHLTIFEKDTYMSFKRNLGFLINQMAKPNLLNRILKDISKRKLKAFLMSPSSTHFNTIIITPINRAYFDIVALLRARLILQAKESPTSLYAIDLNGNISFPKPDVILRYFMSPLLPLHLKLSIYREGLFEKLSVLAIGPKALVRERLKSFLPLTSESASLSHFLSTWTFKVTVLGRVLRDMGYMTSTGIFKKGPVLSPAKLRKKFIGPKNAPRRRPHGVKV